jgi:uncharacterized protein YceK
MVGNLGGLNLRHRMEPYGGVKICLEAGTQAFNEVWNRSTDRPVITLVGGTYMLTIDMPLCAIADTLTLPWTIKSLIKGESTTSPVAWGGGLGIQMVPLEPELTGEMKGQANAR